MHSQNVTVFIFDALYDWTFVLNILYNNFIYKHSFFLIERI